MNLERQADPIAGQGLPAPSHRAVPQQRLALGNYPFRCDVQTRFFDLDPLRHVNNVAMGLLFQESRVAFHAELFRPDGRPDGLQFVVAQINLCFIEETHYPGPVAIGLGVAHIGVSSLRYGQGLFQNGRCTSLCDTTLVARHGHAPIPVSDALRRSLQAFEMQEG